jgi:hypothetical protein
MPTRAPTRRSPSLAACERFYARQGIRIERVLSDNGTCFKRRWAEGCGRRGISVRKTRPYRPQTNGKAERFIRMLLELWAYAYPYGHERERTAAFEPALGGLTPLQRVNNFSGTNTKLKNVNVLPGAARMAGAIRAPGCSCRFTDADSARRRAAAACRHQTQGVVAVHPGTS